MKNVELSDKLNNRYIRFEFSKEKQLWEKWESNDKTNWKLVQQSATFLDILNESEKITNNNFVHLWKMINHKKETPE